MSVSSITYRKKFIKLPIFFDQSNKKKLTNRKNYVEFCGSISFHDNVPLINIRSTSETSHYQEKNFRIHFGNPSYLLKNPTGNCITAFRIHEYFLYNFDIYFSHVLTFFEDNHNHIVTIEQ